MNADPGAFHDFERAGWQKIPLEYERGFGGLTTQSVEPLLDAAAATAGMRLLDIACGPGFATAAAARRGAEATGIDFAPAMVRLAALRHPELKFKEGDAERLDFVDAVFDAVVMNFGMLHLAEPDRAIQEAYRVLRPGGRYAFTVWDLPENAAGFGIVLSAIQAHGNTAVAIPPGPPFFRFSNPEEARRSLEAAGFTQVRSIQVPQTWKLPSGDALLATFRESAVRTAALLNLQTPEALAAIRDSIVARAEGFRKGERIELPMPAILTSAMKPARSR